MLSVTSTQQKTNFWSVN